MAVTSASACASDDVGSQVILYHDGAHIHKLASLPGQQAWTHHDLTSDLKLPDAAFFANVYRSKALHSIQAVYATEDGRIHELFNAGSGWQHAELTSLAGVAKQDLPQSPSDLIGGYAWEAGKSKQVLYWRNGHIFEMSVSTTVKWHYEDLIKNPPTPVPATADAVRNGYGWQHGNSKQLVFRSEDGHVHELYSYGKGWQSADLTQLAKAPAPAAWLINAYAWEAAAAKQVLYVGTDDHMYELTISVGQPPPGSPVTSPKPHWTWHDLTAQTKVGGHELGVVVGGYACEDCKSKHIVYGVDTGAIFEMSYLQPEQPLIPLEFAPKWSPPKHVLPQGGTPPPAGTPFCAFSSGVDRSRHIVYGSPGSDRIFELDTAFGDGAWWAFDRTQQAGL